MPLSITQPKSPPGSFLLPQQYLVLRYDSLDSSQSVPCQGEEVHLWDTCLSLWGRYFLRNDFCHKESMIKTSFTKCINSQAKIKILFDSNRFSMVS